MAKRAALAIVTAVLLAACAAQPIATPPDPLRIVALGDSMAFGSNCPCPPFPQRFSDAMATRLGVQTSLMNFAIPGITSEMLLAMLNNGDRDAILRQAGFDPAPGPPRDIRVDIGAADIVLIEIGANDFLQQCLGRPDPCGITAPDVATRVASVLDAIAAIQDPHPHVVRVIGYYDFCRTNDPAAPIRDSQRCSDFLRTLNAATAALAADREVAFVDLVEPFNGPDGTQDAGRLLSSDHVHPSDAGHQVIADLLTDLGWALQP